MLPMRLWWRNRILRQTVSRNSGALRPSSEGSASVSVTILGVDGPLQWNRQSSNGGRPGSQGWKISLC